jgi:hypothetical protein
MLLVLVSLGVLIAQLLSPPSASAADFRIWVGPDRGAVGTQVTIYGQGDPGLVNRPVVWVCKHLEADDIKIGEVTADANGSWSIPATVPANCVTQPNEAGESQVWVGVYGNGPQTVFTITDTPPDCPSVLFLGAHGINEGAAGGVAGESSWGTAVEKVWTELQPKVSGARSEAGDYPRTVLDLAEVDTPQEVADLPRQISGLETAADEAAAALEIRVITQFVQCGTRTRTVLAGFSLGAWAIDKALRSLSSSHVGRGALSVVAGAGVLGDPAFPSHFCDISPCRMGLATWAGRGYTPDAYLANGISDRFISLCLSYSEADRDWVCGTRNPPVELLDGRFRTRGIQVHNEYDDSGGAKQLADFLAGRVS